MERGKQGETHQVMMTGNSVRDIAEAYQVMIKSRKNQFVGFQANDRGLQDDSRNEDRHFEY